MTVAGKLILAGISLNACLVDAVVGQTCVNVRLNTAKSLFALSASPSHTGALVYGSKEKAEGEIVTGSLFYVRFHDGKGDLAPVPSSAASNPPPPVWSADGSVAYFETNRGIYQFSAAEARAQLLLQEMSVGIALSPDGSRLAYWRIGRGADTLVVYDLKQKKAMRTWQVADRYESDVAGWEIAFVPDGSAVYARTYDKASSTPLKRFDADSGKVELVSQNCLSVVQEGAAIYFVEAAGAKKSLRKITAKTNASELVSGSFDYDSLQGDGGMRWATAQNHRTGRIVALDAKVDTIQEIGKYDSAVVLAEGRQIVVRGNTLVVEDSSCLPGK